VRLQKFMAEAGVASRRASERIILAGRVAVNGETVSKLGTKVDPARDRVTVDGKAIELKRKQYVALHKPVGCVCSRKDECNRPTIYQLLPAEYSGLYSVGRLDYNSEGLILLTNDGQLSLRLTHPRYGVPKKYLATVEGQVQEDTLRLFTRGIWVGTEKLMASRARLISSGRGRSLVELELTEGKNREVRRLFESQGLRVRRLVRTQIGKIKLGDLPPGKCRALTETEIQSLLSQL